MFTGIVQGVAELASLERKSNLSTLGICLPPATREGLQVGASVAINGVCLTVVRWDDQAVYFDAMIETLRLTNLGGLQQGDQINFERAARFSDEIGGHLMSGHVIDQVELTARQELDENNLRLEFTAAPKWMKYIFPKGYIGLNGCSLTLGEVEDNRFSVYLIPETRRATTFGEMQEGTRVNLEIDPQTQVIVDTVERVMASRQSFG
ncbi:riboflavin synthase subunit alpha [Marinospirillum alkaliphilum]|uniref:Riboflavin synthase n=1 Tax=Marinospirillum alkaliphilum DSM 21637 TaxID=1122209 RepID=A0A1K1TCJ8_9GAMM|nr:riboflavin synthase subunit alpha [Marinospirillum alkaliphilum]SFW98272.1 riboflavin synthase alpha chain [Marinospirillum alkaliphilum DSM 21637]